MCILTNPALRVLMPILLVVISMTSASAQKYKAVTIFETPCNTVGGVTAVPNPKPTCPKKHKKVVHTDPDNDGEYESNLRLVAKVVYQQGVILDDHEARLRALEANQGNNQQTVVVVQQPQQQQPVQNTQIVYLPAPQNPNSNAYCLDNSGNRANWNNNNNSWYASAGFNTDGCYYVDRGYMYPYNKYNNYWMGKQYANNTGGCNNGGGYANNSQPSYNRNPRQVNYHYNQGPRPGNNHITYGGDPTGGHGGNNNTNGGGPRGGNRNAGNNGGGSSGGRSGYTFSGLQNGGNSGGYRSGGRR